MGNLGRNNGTVDEIPSDRRHGNMGSKDVSCPDLNMLYTTLAMPVQNMVSPAVAHGVRHCMTTASRCLPFLALPSVDIGIRVGSSTCRNTADVACRCPWSPLQQVVDLPCSDSVRLGGGKERGRRKWLQAQRPAFRASHQDNTGDASSILLPSHGAQSGSLAHASDRSQAKPDSSATSDVPFSLLRRCFLAGRRAAAAGIRRGTPGGGRARTSPRHGTSYWPSL
ncbi:hypothetical protein CDD83_10501 [Cordyceps sp. RAO-2017]|nr:hypothetical protein CDD83_10501 [Cordyceps sp. RAO-2017]